tara:strand:- start:15 stop:1094 length:1080 start_codon:yes stop_codon:yes gene_type:complete
MQMPRVPSPRGSIEPKIFTSEELEREAQRLFQSIGQRERWDMRICKAISPLTLEINELKKEKNVFLIAHSYQTPDIVYGVADSVSDSYTLSKAARDAPEETILFSSVRFMAETAKIVSPHKTILHPSPEAGCSLSDGITPEDVIELRKKYPGVPVACYINTTAAVKAECDVCVTSSNYLRICERLPGDRLIFVPDRFMGKHVQKHLLGKKEVIVFDGECEVHAEFTGEKVISWRKRMSAHGVDLQVLSHPECDSGVLEESDFVGSSELLMKEAMRLASEGKPDIMLITECGTAERILAESEDEINLLGACVMCRHMKRTQLEDILQALRDPSPEQIIEIDDSVIKRASKSLDEMFRLAE